MIAEAVMVRESPVREAERAEVAAGRRLDRHIDGCVACLGVVQGRRGFRDFCPTGRTMERQWLHAGRKLAAVVREMRVQEGV